MELVYTGYNHGRNFCGGGGGASPKKSASPVRIKKEKDPHKKVAKKYKQHLKLFLRGGERLRLTPPPADTHGYKYRPSVLPDNGLYNLVNNYKTYRQHQLCINRFQ